MIKKQTKSCLKQRQAATYMVRFDFVAKQAQVHTCSLTWYFKEPTP